MLIWHCCSYMIHCLWLNYWLLYKKGRSIWEFPYIHLAIKLMFKTQSAITTYMVTDENRKQIVCHDSWDGKVLWRFKFYIDSRRQDLPMDFFTIPASCSWLPSSNENSDRLAPACFLIINPGSDLDNGLLLLWRFTGDDAQSESVSSPDVQWVWSAAISLLGNASAECCTHKFDRLFLSLTTPSSLLNRSLSLYVVHYCTYTHSSEIQEHYVNYNYNDVRWVPDHFKHKYSDSIKGIPTCHTHPWDQHHLMQWHKEQWLLAGDNPQSF